MSGYSTGRTPNQFFHQHTIDDDGYCEECGGTFLVAPEEEIRYLDGGPEDLADDPRVQAVMGKRFHEQAGVYSMQLLQRLLEKLSEPDPFEKWWNNYSKDVAETQQVLDFKAVAKEAWDAASEYYAD